MVQSRDERSVAGVSAADAVLAVIPAWLLGATAGALALPFSVGTALAVASLPATGTIGYAIFWDPPTAEDG